MFEPPRIPPADGIPAGGGMTQKPDTQHQHQTEELERLRQEVKQAKDQYLRTLAEFDNAKKRLHREKEEFARFASETMVRALLPIVDSLDQALVAVDKPSDPQAVIKGIHLIYRQLLGLLEKEGVKRIATVGERFDPHKHEAVAQVDTDGKPEDTVVEEVQVGYTMHGKVIRPAIVKVAKQTATSDTQQATSNNQTTEP
jgi:molecular chaperone GrpE